MRSLRNALRVLLARARFENDMREELRVHIEHRADDLASSGLSRDEALRRARVEFGAMESYKEECRDASGFAPARLWHGLSGDFRLATRRLLATPLFTVFAVLSLAIGIGVTTAVYSVVETVFLKPLSIPRADQLAFVMTPWDGRLMKGGISRPDFEDLRSSQTAFASLSAFSRFHSAVASPEATELLRGEAVDGAYFATLGVQPLIGRTIQTADVAGALPVVVLSHALWKQRFGSDAAVLDRTISISGRPFEVIGVAARDFEGPNEIFRGTRLWIPATADPRPAPTTVGDVPARDRGGLTVIARLASGRTVHEASAELASIGAGLDAAYPRRAQPRHVGPLQRNWIARPITDTFDDTATVRRFGFAIIGLVALVVVVACTNLANLVLARGATRQQEFAVRRALGASRWRLVREQAAESVIVASMGAVASWCVFELLSVAMDVDLPIGAAMLVSFKPTPNLTSGAIAAAALLGSLVVFGLAPAMQLTRERDVRGDLAAASGNVGLPGAKRQRRLLRWQVAISTGFFVIATMCVRYTVAEARHDSGVDLDRIAVATMNFIAQRWDEPRARRAAGLLLEELSRDPAIQSAAVSTGLPFGASMTRRVVVSTTDRPIIPGGRQGTAMAVGGSPQIFRTLGIPILAGRAFDERDQAAASPAVVLSESIAKAIFGTMDVVGRDMLVQGQYGLRAEPVRTVRVIGVARNTDVGRLFKDLGGVVYMPLDQQTGGFPFAVAVVRMDGDPYAAVHRLRDTIRRVDPEIAIESAGTGPGMLGGPTVFIRAAGLLALGLGALTMILAMVGLYGVQSQAVAQRTREIGVRMSFGATASQIKRLVVSDGSRPVLQGLVIGLFIGFVGRAIVRTWVWTAIELADPWMVVVVPIPLVAAALCACYLPARRASRVDPNVALRHL